MIAFISKSKSNQAGFTIVELMIATTVFSVILLLCTYGLTQIGRTYYKGITSARTQGVSRDVVDTISQAIQFGSSAPDTLPVGSPGDPVFVAKNGSSGAFCVGGKRFTYNFNLPVSDATTKGLFLDQAPAGACGAATATDVGRELLGQNMRLTKFQITQDGTDYTISVKITRGDDEDMNLSTADDPDAVVGNDKFGQCKLQRGGEYCASSELMVTVHRRLSS